MFLRGQTFQAIVEAGSQHDPYFVQVDTKGGPQDDLAFDPAALLSRPGPFWSPAPISDDRPVLGGALAQSDGVASLLPAEFTWRRAAAAGDFAIEKQRWDFAASRGTREIAVAIAFFISLDIVLGDLAGRAAAATRSTDADQAGRAASGAEVANANGAAAVDASHAVAVEQGDANAASAFALAPIASSEELTAERTEEGPAGAADGAPWYAPARATESAAADGSASGAEDLGSDEPLALFLMGTEGTDYLVGGAGDDTLIGGAGDDVLDGREGADLMIGGIGSDTYVVDNVADRVVETAEVGVDTVETRLASYELGQFVENLIAIGLGDFDGSGNELANTLVGGIGNDVLKGQAGDDVLVGNAGNDLLDGGTGSDVLVGGLGDDVYVVDDYADQIFETADAGTDTIATSLASHVLGEHAENLIATGTEDFYGSGNELANTIVGNIGNDVLHGQSGNDVLVGYDGNDVLDGGSGADVMVGGEGNDVYIADSRADQIVESADSGSDTVVTSLGRHTLGANVENLVATGIRDFYGAGNELDNTIVSSVGDDVLQGRAGDDRLVGNDGDDVLDGGTGADTMEGGRGNDTYVVDILADAVIEAIDGGHDTVATSLNAYALGETIERLVYAGDGNFVGLGSSGDNELVGGDGDDVLCGDDDYRWQESSGSGGSAGIEAALGAILGTSSDLIVLSDDSKARAPIDWVASSDLILGSKRGEAIVGAHGGNDTIFAGGGNDTIDGGSGNDELTGGSGNDVFIFRAGFGTDTITDFGVTGGNRDIIHIVGDRFLSLEDLEAHMEQVGTDLVITVSASEQIVLANVDKMTLAVEDQFVF